ncbi:MAG: amidase [Hyphomicrobiales bacterium]|nr:amidase [Hyphomicrobiales bacterium]
MTSLAFSTVSFLSVAIDRLELSPVELLDDVLGRLETLEPALNMFAALDIESAKTMARAAEARQVRRERLSPLDGIPTSIKDLIAQKDLPLRFGSRATPDTACPVDAPAVERLRAAGAVLLGKSTTSEFGCKAVGDSPLTGVTRNPWNRDMTPGGSSCGAAAMVASGLVPYAIGTDGGGSIRIPASLTGLFGIKAQFGRVPVFPVSATPTLAHVGPLARTVEDGAAVLSVIAGHDRRDPFSVAGPTPDFSASVNQERRLKIAWSPTLGYAKPDAEVVAVTAAAVARLGELGHAVEEIEHVIDDPVDLWNAEFYAGVGTRLRGVIDGSPELLDPAVLEVLKVAVAQEMGDYYGKVFERYAFRETMRQLFETYDLLVSPTLPTPAFAAGTNVPPGLPDRTIVSWVYYTYPFNLTGQPAASLPVGFSESGLPVGLQVVGGINDEVSILSLCGAYERAFGEIDRRPPSLP